MKIHLNAVDSALMGRPVLDVSDPEVPHGLAEMEALWIAEHRPAMAVARVQSENLPTIHALEELGFRFAECQMTLRVRIRSLLPVDSSGLEHFRVQEDHDLEEVLGIAGRVFKTDRFTLDPALGPEFSQKRYQAYVRLAREAPDQELFALRDISNGRIVAFSSQQLLPNSEVRGLLGAVAEDYQGSGVGIIGDTLMGNLNFKRGFRTVWTAISAINYRVIPVHFKCHGFRVVQTWTVLRKIYGTLRSDPG